MNPLTPLSRRRSIDDPLLSEVDADRRDELVAEFVVCKLVQETRLPDTRISKRQELDEVVVVDGGAIWTTAGVHGVLVLLCFWGCLGVRVTASPEAAAAAVVDSTERFTCKPAVNCRNIRLTHTLTSFLSNPCILFTKQAFSNSSYLSKLRVLCAILVLEHSMPSCLWLRGLPHHLLDFDQGSRYSTSCEHEVI